MRQRLVDVAMTQSVELLPDEATEAAVRRQWDLLAHAGLPSQARHRSSTNRPHVTVAAETSLPAGAEEALATGLAVRLPLPVRLGAVVLFGRERLILVRLVVPTLALLELQSWVAGSVDVEPRSLLAPGRWTPHVTLARGVPRARLPEALAALAADAGPDSGEEGPEARLEVARRWDSDARRTWHLNGPS